MLTAHLENRARVVRDLIPAGCLCALLLALAGCSDSSPAADASIPGGSLQILNVSGQNVGLRPNREATLHVRYISSQGAPIPRAEIQLAIYGNPNGSTLSANRVATDDDGEVEVNVRAGASNATFNVRVLAPGDQVIFNVAVSTADFGSVRIDNIYFGSQPMLSLVKVELFLTHELRCSAFNPVKPPDEAWKRTTSGVGQPVTYGSVPINRGYAVLARAHDAKGVMRATGCVDVPRSVLQAGHTVRISLQLTDILPRVAGSYSIITRITLPKGSGKTASWPRPVADALAPWVDLADCPYDPAQLLLDCVIDAVDSGDPLDCRVPTASLSPRTAALQAERGRLSTTCRGATTSRGTVALDKTFWDLMGKNDKATVVALAKVQAGALTSLAKIRLDSTLELGALDQQGVTLANHQLEIVTFEDASSQTAHKVSQIGLPSWKATSIKATVSTAWALTLARHGLSLRYGLLAREALGELVLAKTGLPTSSSTLATRLAGMVADTFGGKSLSGCAAIEVLACKAARLGHGCLGQACQKGVTALAAHLDRGFMAMDQHPGPDLTLEGVVDLLDSNGNLVVDKLGTLESPGGWTTRLGLADHSVEPREATFTGKRK